MSKTNAVFIPLQIAVITISGSRTFENDSTGDLLQQLLVEQQHQIYQRHILPSQLHDIRACVATLIADPVCQVILLNGGTGFGQDNCTEPAVSVLFDQPVAGFGELFRQLSFTTIGSAALQSRAIAGIANHTLIVAMPGSPNAAELAMVQLILPQLDARQQPCNFVSQLTHSQCDSFTVRTDPNIAEQGQPSNYRTKFQDSHQQSKLQDSHQQITGQPSEHKIMIQTLSFTHLDPSGAAQMVDVSAKTSSIREAIATALVQTTPEVVRQIDQALVKKGDVLAVARVAGIMAAKKTSELIPLCHPLALTKVTIDFALDAALGRIALSATCRVTGPTGVEMEALTAVSVAALTIHDMCKAQDPRLTINQIQLQQKTGGKSGLWQRDSTGVDSDD